MSQFSRVVIASRVVTADVTASVSNTPPLTYGQIIINVSAYTAGDITPSIEGYDPASTTWYQIMVGTKMDSVGQQVLQVGPNFAIVPDVSINTRKII